MLRIVRLSTNQSLTPQQTFKAMEAAQGVVAAANKVKGISGCKLYLAAGDFTFAAEYDGYAAADRLLADPGIQGAVGLLGQEFGFLVSDDEFLLEPNQVYPFIKK